MPLPPRAAARTVRHSSAGSASPLQNTCFSVLQQSAFSGVSEATNAASIDGMIERMEEELGCKCTIVATGGLAKAVIPHCRHDIIIDENLLLKGLQIIYEKNR